jgi:hypothetical protein
MGGVDQQGERNKEKREWKSFRVFDPKVYTHKCTCMQDRKKKRKGDKMVRQFILEEKNKSILENLNFLEVSA